MSTMLHLLVLLVSLALVQPAATAQDARHAQSAAQLATFDEAWRLAGEHFFDPAMRGVDWEAARLRHRPAAGAAQSPGELSRAINALLAELGTSHTAHYTPDDVAYYHLLDIFGGFMLPGLMEGRFPDGPLYEGIEAWLQDDVDGLLITGIWPGGNAERAGLLTGDVILAIGGAPPTPVRAFRRRAGQEIPITFRRAADADPQEAVLLVNWIQPSLNMLEAQRRSIRIIEHAGQRIGYMHILSYAGQQYQDLLVSEIFKGNLAGADALIIDIRGGWGGTSPIALDPFLRGPMMTVEMRDGRTMVVPDRWRKPVAMIIDSGSRSGKEVVAYGMRAYELGLLVGERTAGAVVAGRLFRLPDESLLYLAVADVHVDGERLEGRGVEPHIHVPFERRFAAGADPQLDATVARLAEMAAAGK
jgi:carboxyl-terminal processing protease